MKNRNSNFPKKLMLGGTSRSDLLSQLFKINCVIPLQAMAIILNDWFKVCTEIKEVRLQRKTVADMGFCSEFTNWSDIKKWIKANGEICDLELALRLRLAYRKQPIDEELYIANDYQYLRVANFNGVPSIFRNGCDGYMTDVNGKYAGGDEDMMYCLSDEFVFYQKKRLSFKEYQRLISMKKLIKE